MKSKSKVTTYANVYPDGAVYHHSSPMKAWSAADLDRVGTVMIVIEDGRIVLAKELKLMTDF